MRVQDVVDLAKYSEVSGTAIKDNIEAIVLFINAGMIELHKRFPLYTKEHVVTLAEGQTLYDLPKDFMYALGAYGEVDENTNELVEEVPINEESNDKSVFFPNHKQVQIPLVTNGAFISIIYVAKPKSYDCDDLSDELELPETLIDCLLHYVGYKAHLGIRSDGQSENNSHFMRFERSCDKARELGVAHPIDSLSMPERIVDRGFV